MNIRSKGRRNFRQENAPAKPRDTGVIAQAVDTPPSEEKKIKATWWSRETWQRPLIYILFLGFGVWAFGEFIGYEYEETGLIIALLVVTIMLINTALGVETLPRVKRIATIAIIILVFILFVDSTIKYNITTDNTPATNEDVAKASEEQDTPPSKEVTEKEGEEQAVTPEEEQKKDGDKPRGPGDSLKTFIKSIEFPDFGALFSSQSPHVYEWQYLEVDSTHRPLPFPIHEVGIFQWQTTQELLISWGKDGKKTTLLAGKKEIPVKNRVGEIWISSATESAPVEIKWRYISK